jgi:hypothetical protein
MIRKGDNKILEKMGQGALKEGFDSPLFSFGASAAVGADVAWAGA